MVRVRLLEEKREPHPQLPATRVYREGTVYDVPKALASDWQRAREAEYAPDSNHERPDLVFDEDAEGWPTGEDEGAEGATEPPTLPAVEDVRAALADELDRDDVAYDTDYNLAQGIAGDLGLTATGTHGELQARIENWYDTEYQADGEA